MLSEKIEQIKNYPPYRRWHSIAYLIFLLGCVLVCLSFIISVVTGDNANVVSNVMGYTAMACAILFFVINFVYWRCPRCHKTLPLFGPVLVCNVCERQFLKKDGTRNW